MKVSRRDLYLGTDEDGRLIRVIGADGQRIDGVIEARPIWQELVFRIPLDQRRPGAPTTQTRKMPFLLVHAVTGEVIDDRARP